ncbi:NADP-dependent oxidoreductase [Rhodoligotrophos ferricapiens]|uniref:NADP-dependent oxidoreductase n=1 Tax=Rhodoligotrophos ferricapiens TaxID=3069264 RepID=UPI00315D8540
MDKNRQFLLRKRPEGLPTPDHFELIEAPVPEPRSGEVVTRTLYLSLDPYMRGRMNAGKSYARPVELGAPMEAGVVGRVVASADPGFKIGDIVNGPGYWADYSVHKAASLRKLDPSLAPPSTALGILGMPGHTAYVGTIDIGKPKPGETFVVSAAAGPVGSLAGQIAKIKGARVIGIAGGPDKCRYVVDECGFDDCIDHRMADFAEALAAACPDGIDIYYENVGGAVLQAVWPLLNRHARVPVCGLIAEYNDVAPRPGPNLRNLLSNRILMQGFIVGDHAERFAAFFADVSNWLRTDRIKYREHTVEGLENAPEAFLGLFSGSNFGKLVVRVAAE